MDLESILGKYKNTPNFDGIDLTSPNQRGMFGDAPIHLACELGNLDDVEALVAVGADVNLGGEMGNTALHEAAGRGHFELVKRLLEIGADPLLPNADGATAKDFAKTSGHYKIVQLIDSW